MIQPAICFLNAFSVLVDYSIKRNCHLQSQTKGAVPMVRSLIPAGSLKQPPVRTQILSESSSMHQSTPKASLQRVCRKHILSSTDPISQKKDVPNQQLIL